MMRRGMMFGEIVGAVCLAFAPVDLIEANLVGGTKGGDEMVGVGAVGVAHAKIVNNEAEDDIACVVSA